MKKALIYFLCFLMAIHGPLAAAGDCHLIGSKCVDTTPAKVISGVTITLAEAGGCWQFEDKYECLKPNAVDYCAAIAATPGCWQTSTVCAEAAWTGECIKETRTYRCSDASTQPPANTVQLNTTYTIVQDNLDTTPCQTYSQNPRCHIASHTCVDSTPCKVDAATGVTVCLAGVTPPAGGMNSTATCWQYKDDYSCISNDFTSDCQPLIDAGCRKIDSVCIDTDPTLGCTMRQITYDCISKKGETTTTLDCSAKQVCNNGTCWDAGAPNDTDFAQAVATMEAAREAGAYSPDGLNMFRGVAESCPKKLLANCCKSSGGAQSNNDITWSMIGQGAKYVGETALNAGSKYMFDMMYPGSGWVDSGMQCVQESTMFTPTSFEPGIEMYGLSWGGAYGSLAAGETATGMFGQTIYGLGNGFAFDPYTFVIMVVIMIIMSMMQCPADSKQLAMHRGANLCHFVGSYCSSKFLGVCTETTESYCCFNSKLSKIINEQGRPQIGKSWGSAESPDCSGFSAEQFQQLDFSKIDMSEFVNDIYNSVLPTDTGALQNQIQNNLNNRYGTTP